MADASSGEPTLEQRQLHAELVRRYGEKTCQQAHQLFGLALCLVALSTDVLSAEERRKSYVMASAHLAQLLETLMTQAESAKVSECAKRMDAAIAAWVLDDIEARDGLPKGDALSGR